MKYIKLKKVDKTIQFRFNKVLLGCAYREVDGYYVFVFEPHPGCWNSYILREIADILDDLNEEWDKEIITMLTN